MKNIENNKLRMTPAANARNLENLIAAIVPGGIEAQEKAGQMTQALRETLPLKLGQRWSEGSAEARKQWESLGFLFGETIDDIFVEAKFPDGWKKKPTDHSMWSEVLDYKGRVRGMIFYKAAFYDRSAHAKLMPRFAIDASYASPLVTVSVKDACGEVAFKMSELEQPDWSGNRKKAECIQKKLDEAHEACVRFLRTNYPDYENPCAYWDDPSACR